MLGNQVKRANGLSVSIDWIAFTSNVVSSVDEIIEFLGYSPADFQLMPKGAQGYKKMHRLNGYEVKILSDGTEEMGYHVIISGSAIKDVLQHFKLTLSSTTPFSGNDLVPTVTDFDNTIMVEFLQQLRRIGWLTRLDLAVDDHGAAFFTVEDIRKYIDRQEVVSKFRSFRDISESTLTGERTGHSLYLGSRQSEIMLRIYDKQLEQNKKVTTEDDLILEPWVRWEFEIKNDRANIAADMLIQHKELGEIVMSILNNYVKIVILDDSNRSRCSILPLWKAFVDAVGKLRLFIPEFAKTLEQKERWFVHQCMPTVAGLILANKGDLDVILRHFENGVSRMSNHLRELVEKQNPDWMYDLAGVL